ncbi:MAG: heparinase II/III family protein, partial [Clostridia bacterium]|nr:heparinase II/III family protein [Clostridia bacterium]
MKRIISEDRIAYIKNEPYFKEYIENLKALLTEYEKSPTPVLKFYDMNLYRETGDRGNYETPYFLKRNRLNVFTMMFLLFGEEKYKILTEESLFDLCSEYTWCLPAHFHKGESGGFTHPETIDLFAAETGAFLAEIINLLGDKLNPVLVGYVKNEIRRRILKPYFTEGEWERWGKNNWSAVCGGSVGMALLYEGTDEEIEKYLPKVIGALDWFLESFENDGCCMEGATYWDYGFGFYVYFAERLKEYTGGRTDLLKSEKVRSVALYRHKVFLNENIGITFSDAGGVKTNRPLNSYLAENIDGVPLLCDAACVGVENLKIANSWKWFAHVRYLAWVEPSKIPEKLTVLPYVYFEDACWYIKNTGQYHFAAKGGHNAEPHNHNDLGSFILADDEKQILADFGCGNYCKQYFWFKTRYDFLVNSSRGHSVPILDGEYQHVGEEFSAKVIECTEDMFKLDLSNAYESGKKVIRSFEMQESGIKITDEFSDSKFTERFATYTEPVLKEGKVLLDSFEMQYDSNAFSVSVIPDSY